jgi:hypothetical protein
MASNEHDMETMMSSSTHDSRAFRSASELALMGPEGNRNALRYRGSGTPLPIYINNDGGSVPPPGSATVSGAPVSPSGVPGSL